MSDLSFRRVARTGLAPLMEDVPDGPEWTDLTPETALTPLRSARFGWLAGVGAAVVVLVVIGVAAFLTGEDPVPPPATGNTQSRDWVAIDYPEGYSAANDLMIWADDRIFLWGGQTDDVEESPTGEPGWSYELNTGEWTHLPESLKDPAIGAGGVWTGEEVIICCGTGEQFADFATTVAFNPETGEWRRLADAPISGTFTEAVWTGDEMLVIASGGVAAYEPSSDSWTTYPAPPESARLNEIAWTGEELIVWSREVERVVHPGYALTPSTGEWRQLPDPPAWPAAPDIVWTGDRLVIWGGLPAHFVGSERAVGSVYDPETNAWTEMSEALPEPEPFEGNLGSQSLGWTGDRVLVSPGAFASGVAAPEPILLAYDPPSDTWELVDQSQLPTAISPADAVLVGDPIVVRSDRIYISPYGWVPEGERITADSWAATTPTTTTVPTTTTLAANMPADGPIFGEETGMVLLLDNGLEGLTAIDPDARRAARSPVTGQRPGDEPFSMVRVGDQLVVGWANIHAVDIATRQGISLGSATVFVPSAAEGNVWMIDYPGGSIGSGRPTVWQANTAGETTIEPRVLNSDLIPLFGIDGGLALQSNQGIELWDATTGEIRKLAGDGPGFAHDVSDETLAWCSEPCDTLNLTNTSDLTSQQYEALGGVRFVRSTFSDNDRYLAAVLSPVGDAFNGASVFLLDRETGQTTILPRPETGPIHFVAWAPDNDQLFMTGYSYGERTTPIWHYRLSTNRLSSVVVPVGGGLTPVIIDRSVADAYFEGDTEDF